MTGRVRGGEGARDWEGGGGRELGIGREGGGGS